MGWTVAYGAVLYFCKNYSFKSPVVITREICFRDEPNFSFDVAVWIAQVLKLLLFLKKEIYEWTIVKKLLWPTLSYF